MTQNRQIQTRASRPPTGLDIRLPHSIEAEQAVLGAVMIEPRTIHALDLTPEDFFTVRHGIIWRAMQHLRANNRPCDYLLVMQQIEADGQIEEIGGSSYLTSLLNTVPTAALADEYAQTVREMAERRAFGSIAGEIVAKAFNLQTDLAELRSLAIRQITSSLRLRNGARPVRMIADETLREIDRAIADPRDIYGIPTGFLDLDKQTRGLQLSEVVIVAGASGMGKSVLAGQIAFNAASAGFPVAFYGLEMRAVANVRRMLSAETRIRTTKMRSGRLSEDEYQRIVEELGRLGELPLYISDDTGWTTASLRADVARLKAQYDVQLVVVDYIGLLKDEHQDLNERDKIISAGLLSLAKDLNIAVIAVHTLNKIGAKARKVSIADMGGSVRIGYDCHVALLLTHHIPEDPDEPPQPNMRTITIDKFREDDAGRYVHLVRTTVKETTSTGEIILKGLPRFGDYVGDYL